jgi:hypothetical protein
VNEIATCTIARTCDRGRRCGQASALLAEYVHRCAVPICLMCTSGAPRPDPAPSCIPSEASSFSKSAAGCAEMSNETP